MTYNVFGGTLNLNLLYCKNCILCPLFYEFRDFGNFVKMTGANLVYYRYLLQRAKKTPK